MDAKSRMNFINAVVGEGKIPCPVCGALNVSDAQACSVCGAALSPPAAPGSTAAQSSPATMAPQSAPDEEPTSVFALGLPSWDLTPPQVPLRRKKR